jgi:hypothetical protein
MEISDESKIDILIAALEERYKSVHIIRERTQSIALWIVGALLTISVALIGHPVSFTEYQKWTFTGVLLVIGVFVCYFLFRDQEKGFKNQQRTKVNLEKVLGLYKENFFGEDSGHLYLSEWASAGTKKGKGNFFSLYRTLILVSVLALLITIWYI